MTTYLHHYYHSFPIPGIYVSIILLLFFGGDLLRKCVNFPPAAQVSIKKIAGWALIWLGQRQIWCSGVVIFTRENLLGQSYMDTLIL
jgi:hypothetical protein